MRMRAPARACSSVGAFARLVASGELRLGRSYMLCDGRRYRVFRETVRRLEDEPRTVIEVGFRLRLIGAAPAPHWLFQRLCILTTPFWSGFPGFATKLWMVDPETLGYAGIYAWDSAESARDYPAVLLPVLRAVSVRGSVFAEVRPERGLEEFLRVRAEVEPRQALA